MRFKVGETLCGLKRRLQLAAWFKWTTGKHLFEDENEEDVDTDHLGKGSQLLHTAQMQRKVRVMKGLKVDGAGERRSRDWEIAGHPDDLCSGLSILAYYCLTVPIFSPTLFP